VGRGDLGVVGRWLGFGGVGMGEMGVLSDSDRMGGGVCSRRGGGGRDG
jgi:hypothetical protein